MVDSRGWVYAWWFIDFSSPLPRLLTQREVTKRTRLAPGTLGDPRVTGVQTNRVTKVVTKKPGFPPPRRFRVKRQRPMRHPSLEPSAYIWTRTDFSVGL